MGETALLGGGVDPSSSAPGGMVVLHLRKLGGISLSRKGKGAVVDVEVDLDAAGDDVAAFRKIVTAALDLDEGAWERLRLVYKGRVLHDYDGGLPDIRAQLDRQMVRG